MGRDPLTGSDLGGDRLESGLVAVGKREIGAARGKFQRERATDTPGRARHGDRSPPNCSHGSPIGPKIMQKGAVTPVLPVAPEFI
jgi:hypothetical protein